jgi:hypothetical protein
MEPLEAGGNMGVISPFSVIEETSNRWVKNTPLPHAESKKSANGGGFLLA